MSPDIVLYTNPQSRGRVARWMLEEVGVPYRAEVLGYGPPMKTPDYLAINPMGKVPALVHGATVVTENAAICAYLADAFPAAGLAPPPAERGAYYRWFFFLAGPFEAAIFNRALGLDVPADKQVAIGYGTCERALDTLEQAVSRSDYLAASSFTAVDLFAGALLDFGMRFGMVEKRAAFEAYAARMTGREASRRAAAKDDAPAAAV
ncbi:glutathione S-transferase family protein [Ancylobacter terrae]|uniref:glutathione S-transferase family protein n=1 Tax=Ancylobacter sp. sgz301288 TaxID=3342077 RepID=UPI00385F3573